MSDIASFFEQGETDDIRRMIIDAVEDWAYNRPRQLQKRIGPSGAGVECNRRLAYAVSNERIPDGSRVQIAGDVLPSVSGTALHAVMEQVFGRLNEMMGRERFLIEAKVKEPIAGTCDLFDTDTGTVLDWKFLGSTSFPKFVKVGPVTEYRIQGMLYGLGMENLGYEVKRVGIVAIPRAGRLRDLKPWIVDYDKSMALAAADRVEKMEHAVEVLGAVKNPYAFGFIPATPSPDNCKFCPHFSAAEKDIGNPWACPGYLDPDRANERIKEN